MDSRIFNAILSMDSYNRGYNASIDLSGVGSQIGNAVFFTDSTKTPTTSAGQAVGFYASAYNYNGSTIISYRGTDSPAQYVGNDVITGWIGGAGFVSSQSGLAFAFYNDVAKSLNSNVAIDPRYAGISLTGHSLGGGLAGLVDANDNAQQARNTA